MSEPVGCLSLGLENRKAISIVDIDCKGIEIGLIGRGQGIACIACTLGSGNECGGRTNNRGCLHVAGKKRW